MIVGYSYDVKVKRYKLFIYIHTSYYVGKHYEYNEGN